MSASPASGRDGSPNAADSGSAEPGDADAGLLRAVRGGQRLQALEDALTALSAAQQPEPVPKPPIGSQPTQPTEPVLLLSERGTSEQEMKPERVIPEPPPRRRLTPGRVARFIGRRGLRAVRPFVLPFLSRFEWRVRTAVDTSAHAAATASDLRALRQDADARREALARESAEIRLLLDRGLLAVETLRRETAEAAAAHQAVLARHRADALRLFEHTEARLNTVGGQLDHSHLVLDVLRREAAQREEAAARDRGDSLRLLQRGVVPLDGRDYLVRTPSGWLVVPGEDERLLMAMVEGGGVLERGTTAVLAALLRPGDTMVDVGAHIGTMTLPAARAVGPAGRVIAVEPGARAAALLRRSLHINSLAEQVSLHECAAGAATGEALLHLAPVLGENTLVASDDAPAGEAITVALRPLDDIVPAPPRGGGARLAVVKIDAEGYELEVWKGMGRILADNPELAVVVEFGPSHLARAGIAPAAWLDALRAAGFTPWEIDEATGALHPLRATADLAAVFSMNLLLLRRPPSAWPGLRVA